MSRKKNWSHTAGEYPHSVRVFERKPGGMLYATAWDGSAQRKVSLRHKDRELAIAYAQEEAAKLRDGSVAVAASPTAGFVLMQYLVHRTPKKGINADGTLNPERQKNADQEDRRRAELWRKRLGPTTQLRVIGRAEWESFIVDRGSGAIDARGNPVLPKDRVKVSPRTVDADLVFMVAVMNWATSWTVNGRPLLEKNPWGATAAGVKRSLQRPKTLEPKRPIATYDRFVKIRAAAEQLTMIVSKDYPGATLQTVARAKYRLGEGPVNQWRARTYLPELLDLCDATGRRITAVLGLRYSDIVRTVVTTKKRKKVLLSLKWRTIKGSKPKVVQLNQQGHDAIQRVLEQRPGIGDAWLFPAPKNPKRALSRYVARDWHGRAEELAGVEHLPGGVFHPYRRTWATVRKHHPVEDRMNAGGWEDPRSLSLYTLPDDDSTIAVIEETRRLRERKA